MDTYLISIKTNEKNGRHGRSNVILPGANKMKEQMDQCSIDEKMLIENEALFFL